jgi:hypothetical protein
MENEDLKQKIRDLLGTNDLKFSVMDAFIPVELQAEYFEYSSGVKKDLDSSLVLANKDWLFLESIPVEDKRRLLAQLGSIAEPESYRTLEKFLKSPVPELELWAKMALMECRLLLESTLLEESQVFISTGLGGKDNKLRYFLVFFMKPGKTFNKTYKKVIANEFNAVTERSGSEIEKYSFSERFVCITALVPLIEDVQDLFRQAVKEANVFGDFLDYRFIITNVKVLSEDEINDFVKERDGKQPDK